MITYLQKIEWFIGLVLLQVLVLNHMHINGYATPFFFIYFILKYNSGVSRNVLMVWAFLLGLSVENRNLCALPTELHTEPSRHDRI